jgi:hypothetical protein
VRCWKSIARMPLTQAIDAEVSTSTAREGKSCARTASGAGKPSGWAIRRGLATTCREAAPDAARVEPEAMSGTALTAAAANRSKS